MPSPSEQFRSALNKGLGRAMLLLRAAPEDPDFGAALRHACTVNLVYDWQCEKDRVDYLYRLICVTGHIEFYRDELLRHLSGTEQDIEPLDQVQIFGILCMIARNDPGCDRAFLRDFLCDSDFDEVASRCFRHVVWLEGLDGVLLYFRHFYSMFGDDDRPLGVLHSLVEALIERDGAESAASALRAARLDCTELNELMSLDERTARPVSKDDNDGITLTYADLKASLDSKYGYFHRSWVETASPTELAQAADDLMAESDERKLRCYLKIFWTRDFPLPPKTLVHFLSHSNQRIAHWTVNVLKRLSHPDIRNLALEILSEGTQPARVASLLTKNFQPGDLTAIQALVERLALDDNDWHHLGTAVLDLLYEADVPEEEGRSFALQLYENGPCSLCRNEVVLYLIATSGVPDWMAEECRFDAEPRIVKHFA